MSFNPTRHSIFSTPSDGSKKNILPKSKIIVGILVFILYLCKVITEHNQNRISG